MARQPTLPLTDPNIGQMPAPAPVTGVEIHEAVSELYQACYSNDQWRVTQTLDSNATDALGRLLFVWNTYLG